MSQLCSKIKTTLALAGAIITSYRGMCLSSVAGMGPSQRDKSPGQCTDEGVGVRGSIAEGADGGGMAGWLDLEETVEHETHRHRKAYIHTWTDMTQFVHTYIRSKAYARILYFSINFVDSFMFRSFLTDLPLFFLLYLHGCFQSVFCLLFPVIHFLCLSLSKFYWCFPLHLYGSLNVLF